MSDTSINTLHMHRCVERWQGGDRAAADELLQALGARLEHLTRKMLRGFPNVRGWAETVDVLQGSLIRLLRSLKEIRPDSTRSFFNLAAVQIRRELLDLARHFGGKAFAHVGGTDGGSDSDLAGPNDPADHRTHDNDLELWCRFHEAVDQLPAEDREVISLVFYHGWTQVQIAELFSVDERTVRRRWQSACLKLNQLVGDRLPTP